MAIAALIAAYYVFNFDYPKEIEVALTILQMIIFEDCNAPKKIVPLVNAEMASFQSYLLGEE